MSAGGKCGAAQGSPPADFSSLSQPLLVASLSPNTIRVPFPTEVGWRLTAPHVPGWGQLCSGTDPSELWLQRGCRVGLAVPGVSVRFLVGRRC